MLCIIEELKEYRKGLRDRHKSHREGLLEGIDMYELEETDIKTINRLINNKCAKECLLRQQELICQKSIPLLRENQSTKK